jgi:hypothetical protein
MIKSRMRWVGHVLGMGESKGLYWVLVGKTEGKGPFEDLGIDGRIILRWIFRKWDMGGMEWNELSQDSDSWGAFVNAVTNLRVP